MVSPVFSFTWLFLLQDVADVTIPDDMRRMAYWQKSLIATRQTSQPIYMIIKNVYLQTVCYFEGKQISISVPLADV